MIDLVKYPGLKFLAEGGSVNEMTAAEIGASAQELIRFIDDKRRAERLSVQPNGIAERLRKLARRFKSLFVTEPFVIEGHTVVKPVRIGPQSVMHRPQTRVSVQQAADLRALKQAQINDPKSQHRPKG